MFKGSDNFDQLHQITTALGTDDLEKYVKAYKIDLDPAYQEILTKQNKKDLRSFVDKSNEHLATDKALDLLSKMLLYDHNARLTAKECMEHPYFGKYNKDL